MNTKPIHLILIVMGMLLLFPSNLGNASISAWTEPENLSGWQDGLSPPWLLVGEDGTQAIFWIHYDITNTREAVWGRVRRPGGEWSTAKDIFGWRDFNEVFPQFGITLDGKVWAVTVMPDKSHPGDNLQVKAAGWLDIKKWEIDILSDYESEVRDLDLSTGPEGHLAITWVACATSTSEDQGPCDVRVQRRKPNASLWEPRDDSIDTAVTGVLDARSLVGHEGMVVTTWAEYSQTSEYEWHVMSSTFDPGPKTWEFPPEDISDGGFMLGMDPFLAEPVMGSDGTVVAGWYARHPSQPNKSKLLAVTRQGNPDIWSLPVPLADYHIPSGDNPLRLTVGEDGTAVAAWVQRHDTVSKYALYANQRDPGSTWLSNPIRVTNWNDRIELAAPQVWPDGSSILLWKVVDNGRPVSESQTIFWSARSPKGIWGDLGSSQLDGWYKEVFSVDLAVAKDGSVTAVWGIEDTSQPPGEYAGAMAANWKPGLGDVPVTTLTTGYHSVYLSEDGVVIKPDGSPAAAWDATKYFNNPNPTAMDAAFYVIGTAGAYQDYLPLVVKSAN
jgi:hypothetical protein